MKSWLRTLAATCMVIPLAQCAIAPGGNSASANEPVAATTARPAPATIVAKPAMWAVKDADTTIYLFGTVHVLKPGLSWFDGAVKAAFEKSDELKLELVLPEDQAAIAQTTLALAVDKGGKTIPQRLDPDALTAYRAALTGLGLPANQFDIFEPWFAAVTLSVLPLTKLGYDPEQGAEKQLTAAAKAAGKRVSGFETLEEQLGFFDTLPEAGQVEFLNSVVKDIDTLAPTLDKLVVLWSKGQPQKLAKLLNESMTDTPELARTLLWNRNERWADAIKARMAQPGTVFVAVGAGHLAGQHSVQDYLKERGLKAKRVE